MATVVKLATSTRRWLAEEGEENEQDKRGDLCGGLCTFLSSESDNGS